MTGLARLPATHSQIWTWNVGFGAKSAVVIDFRERLREVEWGQADWVLTLTRRPPSPGRR